MKHRLTAFFLALILALSTVLCSVSAFAADEALGSGNKFLDSYFSDWEEVGEQALALRDAYHNWLVAIMQPDDLMQLLGASMEIPIAWLRVTEAGLYALCPTDNFFYWLVNDVLVFDDRTSGESVKKNIDQTVEDPTIYLPTPWIQIVKPDSPAPGGKDLGGIISDVGTGVGGVFSISKSGFDFLTGNNLTMFILSISFAGVALGFVARAFRTSRK